MSSSKRPRENTIQSMIQRLSQQTQARAAQASANAPQGLPATEEMQKRVSAHVSAYMRRIGSEGGHTPSAQRTRFNSESGRQAVLRRWAKQHADGLKPDL